MLRLHEFGNAYRRHIRDVRHGWLSRARETVLAIVRRCGGATGELLERDVGIGGWLLRRRHGTRECARLQHQIRKDAEIHAAAVVSSWI